MSDPVRGPQGDPSNRRTHYRVEYPVLDRPEFRAGALEGLVDDCSETGVRVSIASTLPADHELVKGERLGGTILFANGDTIEVQGEVIRFDRKKLVLHLDAGPIPFGKIIKQQFWLRAKYPWRDQ